MNSIIYEWNDSVRKQYKILAMSLNKDEILESKVSLDILFRGMENASQYMNWDSVQSYADFYNYTVYFENMYRAISEAKVDFIDHKISFDQLKSILIKYTDAKVV